MLISKIKSRYSGRLARFFSIPIPKYPDFEQPHPAEIKPDIPKFEVPIPIPKPDLIKVGRPDYDPVVKCVENN